MSNNRQIAKNAIFLYVRMAIVMVVTIYMSRVILAHLGEVDYGIYNVVGGVVGMIMSLNSALSFGTQRFISFYIGKGEKLQLTKVFSSAFLIHIFLGIIVIILLEIVGVWFVNNILVMPTDRLFAVQVVLQISIFTSFVAIIQVPYSALIIAHERMNIYAYVALVDVGLKLLIALSLVSVTYDKLIYYAVLLSSVQIIQSIIYIFYCKKCFSECRVIIHKDKKMYTDILKYAGWNLFGTLGFMGSDQGVNMILNVFFGPTVNAARAIAYQVKSAVQQFASNLQIAFNPQLVKLYAAGNKDAMLGLLYDNIKYCLLLMWVIFLPLFFEIDYLLSIWLIKVPQYTLIFTKIILFKLFLVCFEQPFITINGATGDNKTFTIVSALFLLSTLPISYMLLKLENIPYLVFGVDFVVYFIMVVWKSFYLRKQVGLSLRLLFIYSIKPLCIIILFSTILVWCINGRMDQSFIRLIATIVTSIVINAILIWKFAFTVSLKKVIKNKISLFLFH